MDKAQLDAKCECASGKQGGACCLSGEDCPCGSGDNAGNCCYAEAEAEG